MLSADVTGEIGKAVMTALFPTELLRVICEEGQDHDGNDVVFVTLTLPDETGPLPATVYMRAMVAASQALLQSHDERVPLVYLVRDGGPDLIEEGMDRAS